jgi:hypothetical protein
MSKLDKLRQTIRAEIGATGRRALVVEGTDDMAALRIWLSRRDPNWESRWVLAEAKGKAKVIAIAALEPDWVGLVDRDEMSDAELADHAAARNLVVLPHFCIESYACVPSEIWPAILPVHRWHCPGSNPDFLEFENEIVGILPTWRRHAALWNAVNPLWRRLTAEGFNVDLLNPANVYDDTAVQQKLNSWAGVLAPAQVFGSFQTELSRVQALSADEFLRTTVYAKKFYPMVVHAVLNRLLGQAPENDRLRHLFQNIPVPADLDPLWQAMELKA